MYISTWIIIIIVIVGIYFYRKSKKQNKSISENQLLTADEMWVRAEVYMERVMRKSPNIEKYLQDERDMVKAMERDMVRLRERFKHDPKKQLEIAQGWMDYSHAVERIKFSRELLDVDMEHNAYDSHDERTKEAWITIPEIAKRVENILGKDSSSKLVHDRLYRNAEATGEVVTDFVLKNKNKS